MPTHRRRILVGAVESSRYDFEFLDLVSGFDEFEFRDIFMLSDCGSQSEIETYIPGATPVYHSPAIGIWEDGNLVARANGFGQRNKRSQYTGHNLARLRLQTETWRHCGSGRGLIQALVDPVSRTHERSTRPQDETCTAVVGNDSTKRCRDRQP